MNYLRVLSILVIRCLPAILAIGVMITILSFYLGYTLYTAEVVWIVYYFCQLLGLWILSKTFKFCVYHQLIIYYLFITYGIMNIDIYIGIPISAVVLQRLLLALSGITLIAVIITYLKYGDRKISQKDKLTD
jgi:hypothetical protein